MMTKKRLLVIVAVVIVGALLFGWWWRGGVEPSMVYTPLPGKPHPFAASLFYRGLNIPGTDVVFLKRYYAIAGNVPDTELTTDVEFHGVGYNRFLIFYKDGTLAGQGLCQVDWKGDQIYHNIHDVKEGRFYDPQGNLVSSVESGTGVQTLFYADGTKYWELHLEDFRRKRVTLWNRDGSVDLGLEY